jgi:urease accessory protein
MIAAPEARPDPAALWRLMLWSSPAFPVGAFAHSHGLEWSVETGDVRDLPSLRLWLDDLLAHGAGRTDAILLAHAHRAAAAGDRPALGQIAALASALAPSEERQIEAQAQGAAFVRALSAAWPTLGAVLPGEGPVPYAVAVGAACGAAGVPLVSALVGYLQAFAGMLVSAAVRLVPLGQSDGLRALAGLEPRVLLLADEAAEAPLEAIGGASFRADIASMLHETQYTRLFRT